MIRNFFSRFASADADTIGHEDFVQAVGAGEVTVVDVREPNEYATGHIAQALNMPMSQFDARRLPDGKPIVFICQAGGRSRNALMKARAAGCEDARHYASGMNGWRSRGEDVAL